MQIAARQPVSVCFGKTTKSVVVRIDVPLTNSNLPSLKPKLVEARTASHARRQRVRRWRDIR
jgi:hypothetical protein